MNISITSINIATDKPTYMTTKDIKAVPQDGMHLQNLKTYIIEGWPSDRNDI